jgi:hypothetical protein
MVAPTRSRHSQAIDDPEQSKRFIEAARKVGAAKTKAGADRAFKSVVASSIASQVRPCLRGPPSSARDRRGGRPQAIDWQLGLIMCEVAD